MQPTASAAAGAASSTQRQLVDLSLTLGGVQYEKRNRLTDERRIQLPPDWARQLQVDAIEVQGRDGVYVGNYFGGGGLCSLATFDEMERELGWDEIDVKKIPEFGTPRNPVCLRPTMLSLPSFMKMALPSLEFVAQTPTASSSTSVPNNMPADLQLRNWQGVAQSVIEGATTLYVQHDGVHIPESLVTFDTTIMCKGNSNAALLGFVLAPVNGVLKKITDSKATYTLNSSQVEGVAVPDFVMRKGDSDNLCIVTFAEGKALRVLEEVDDLVEAWRNKTHNVRRKIIPQVYNYSVCQGLRFCCLYNGRKLWLMRAASRNSMEVSKAFFWEPKPGDPTLREIMLWVALRASGPEGALPEEDRPQASNAVKAGGGATKQNQQVEAAAAAHEPAQGYEGRVTRSMSLAAAESSTTNPIDDGAVFVMYADEFEEKAPIGYGETGTVISAWLHGRHVAVKFGDCFNSKPKVLRLRNEVAAYKAMEQLQGRFLPRLEEYGYTGIGGSFFVATQLIKGHTHKAGSEVPMWQRSATEQALAAIHEAGFLHGDVRSDNLIFEEGTGRAVFLDLGFSRACTIAEEHEEEMEQLRTILTPSPTSVHAWPRS